jgi:Fibronectin type III domain/Glucodextranase, domain B/Bacterial Ig domain
MKAKLIIITLFLVFLSPALLFAGSAILRWEPNAESDFNNYNVYYGTQSRSYEQPVPVGKSTSYNLNELDADRTYYFAVTAIDTSGNESGFSAEVSKTIPPQTDNTAPTLTINSPTAADQYDTDTATIQIAGGAADDIGIEQVYWTSSSGQSGMADGTTDWRIASLNLSEGLNVLTVVAVDPAGNQGSDTLNITYTTSTTGAPTVQITSPTAADTYSTETAFVTVRGTASGDHPITRVTWTTNHGHSGTASGTANWSITGTLPGEDVYVVTVTAHDDAGQTAQDILTINYGQIQTGDTTPPAITISSPSTANSYTTSAATTTIAGTASDNAGIQQVRWTSSSGQSGTADGTTAWRIPSLSLSEGLNVITVTAVDPTGNQSSDTLNVTYTAQTTNAPTVQIAAPTNADTYDTNSGFVVLRGTASSDRDITRVTWTTNRGHRGTASGTENWSITGTLPSTGLWVVTVTAYDATGQSAQDALTINYMR